MEDLPERHRRWVANAYSGKINELHHQLAVVVAACDRSLHMFSTQMHVPNENHRSVTFGFSAFLNAVQTLKDSVQIITRQQLPWSKIEGLRHGSFIRGARNATTHDGHPVVDGWADGRYFVPAKIVRIDNRGDVIQIEAPKKDIRTVSLDFAKDFCVLLKDTLAETENVKDLIGTPFSITELDETFANSTFIPEFAAQLFFNNRQAFEAGLEVARHDPIAKANKSLEDAIRYCEAMRKG
ncbi:hypothetical protein QCE63_06860 [Caballeronia sp. LZ065]|uniref:hypothetical protein n=1 Tax=Caballeronia sp. LZ065 TaxID=3038571 RepID=UPI002859EA8E|nr:hypothetical protein [Caballeronia sp. LZ065]MDR5779148.1 hypothetical protein [Caballeronia sp. LZ065]